MLCKNKHRPYRCNITPCTGSQNAKRDQNDSNEYMRGFRFNHRHIYIAQRIDSIHCNGQKEIMALQSIWEVLKLHKSSCEQERREGAKLNCPTLSKQPLFTFYMRKKRGRREWFGSAPTTSKTAFNSSTTMVVGKIPNACRVRNSLVHLHRV